MHNGSVIVLFSERVYLISWHFLEIVILTILISEANNFISKICAISMTKGSNSAPCLNIFVNDFYVAVAIGPSAEL